MGKAGRQTRGRGQGQGSESVEQNLPAGPKSLEDVLNFPDFVAARLFEGEGGSDRVHRLRSLVGPGLQLQTQYSGKGTAETSAAQLRQSLLEHEWLDASVPWYSASAYDSKDFARQVLLNHCSSSRPKHIFKDMEVCLCPDAAVELRRLQPAKAQRAEEREEAYKAMQRYLQANMSFAFPGDRSAACSVHGSSPSGCCVWPEQRPDELRLFVAGQTCKDVSRRGSRHGFAGEHTASYVVWIGVVRHHRPHMFIHEITTSQEAAQRLATDLGDLYHIETCGSVSPHHLGIPVRRNRQYSVGVLKGKLMNLGSWEEFFQIMSSRLELRGDIYFVAPPSFRDEVGRAAAKKQGWSIPADQAASLRDQLTPAEFRRFCEYQKIVSETGPPGPMPQDFFCVDVHQEAEYGGIYTLAPCLLAHCKLVHGSQQIVATGLEHLLIMGALYCE